MPQQQLLDVRLQVHLALTQTNEPVQRRPCSFVDTNNIVYGSARVFPTKQA